MALPNKTHLLKAYGDAVAIELDETCTKYNYDIVFLYDTENKIILYCNFIFTRIENPRAIYVPFYYKEFILNIQK